MCCQKQEGDAVVQYLNDHGDESLSLEDLQFKDVHIASFLICVIFLYIGHSIHS